MFFWKRKSRPPQPAPDSGVSAEFLSDVGCHREINEDSAAIIHPQDAETLASRGILAVVADGMGGHEAGEVASRMAVEAVTRVYYAERGEPGEALLRAFQQANREVFEYASSRAGLTGMGSTCTALALTGRGAWLAHVGDSRMYLVRRGGIYQMTEDHSAVMEMVRRGLIGREEARHHEDRNVLVRALGSHAELEVSSWPEPMPVLPGDRFVICSDGLHDGVPEAEIRDAALTARPAAACRLLVDAARLRGGYDNITVAIVAVDPPPGDPAALRATRTVEVMP
jgi:protein phosphatase